MFATLAGGYPRPDLPPDASPDDVVRAVVAELERALEVAVAARGHRFAALTARILRARVGVVVLVEAVVAGFTGRLLLGRTAGGMDLGQRAVQATFADEQGSWRVVRAQVEPVP